MYIVLWVICAAIQLIPTVLGIIGWVLTAKNNGSASAVYVVQTFLPAVITIATYVIPFIIFNNFQSA